MPHRAARGGQGSRRASCDASYAPPTTRASGWWAARRMRRMTRDEILALLGRRDAAWKARDPGALAATHTPDGVAVSPTGGVLEGRAEIERVYKLWLTAFPDVVFQPQDLVIEGDRVVQLARIVGTHA